MNLADQLKNYSLMPGDVVVTDRRVRSTPRTRTVTLEVPHDAEIKINGEVWRGS